MKTTRKTAFWTAVAVLIVGGLLALVVNVQMSLLGLGILAVNRPDMVTSKQFEAAMRTVDAIEAGIWPLWAKTMIIPVGIGILFIAVTAIVEWRRMKKGQAS